jgi:hypothetical protein
MFNSFQVIFAEISEIDAINDKISKSLSFKVKFTRESPNDFYLSGDRVQGIVQVVTYENGNDLNRKYGPLHVELIGELNDFLTNSRGGLYARSMRKFFRKQARVEKLPNDNRVRYIFIQRKIHVDGFFF